MTGTLAHIPTAGIQITRSQRRKAPNNVRQLRFVDLFAGLGGFHLALSGLGHLCVYASEIDNDLADLYEHNFSLRPSGDLRQTKEEKIPPHDVLCAGFPCQPFSKAGEQLGTKCKLWGDLFEHVLRVLSKHRPQYVIMENVANLEKHDGGRTWKRMRESLEGIGYSVDTAIISPHQFGIPQIRDRLFIVCSQSGLSHFTWPTATAHQAAIHTVLDRNPTEAKPLTKQVLDCLDVWQEFLERAPKDRDLPSFPIWTMEFGATYPYQKYDSLYNIPLQTLRQYRGTFGCSLNTRFRNDIISRVPSYGRDAGDAFPVWKQDFIRKNRRFYLDNKKWIKPWLPKIKSFPPSLQKFEWNCKNEERNLWNMVVQFRASGVRVKRPTTAPSLVAMTTTQVPIIAWEKRYMTPRECSRLQCLDELPQLPRTHTKAFKALGNAVNARVVRQIAAALLST